MTVAGLIKGYDSIAGEYDSLLEADASMRRALWTHYLGCFRRGQSVLDVACGTGLDTLLLARNGIHVTAMDVSGGMITQLDKKVASEKPEGSVHTLIMDTGELPETISTRFDGMVSGFAGLNSVEDLGHFAANAAGLLKPGGRMMLHMLNRCSLWKLLRCICRLRWSEAEELRRRCERIYVIGDQPVQHWLYFPIDAYQKFFAPHFELCHVHGMGIFYPPLPPGQLAEQLERWLGRFRPFYNWGRFYLLDLKKRG